MILRELTNITIFNPQNFNINVRLEREYLALTFTCGKVG